MFSNIFTSVMAFFSFFPPWLVTLIIALFLFMTALFVWRLIK